MKDISLYIEGNAILKNVDFYANRGEVCALLGENAAGKSSLMKVLCGIYKASNGQILINGTNIASPTITKMQEHGIYMIQQHTMLVNDFTVEQNMFIGKEINYHGFPLINKKYQQDKAKAILKSLNPDIDVNAVTSSLTVAQKKVVEIAKTIVQDAKALIFDEANAAFSYAESEVLLQMTRILASEGIAIIFISHKLEDVLKISDRITIMRDGCMVEDNPVNVYRAKSGYNMLLSKMAGTDYTNRYPKTRSPKGNILLELRDVAGENNIVKDASVYIRSGEIVGIAGMQGAGKTSLSHIIAGAERISQGRIIFQNKQ
jgi:ribose transport system ATP-binding protein